MTDIDEATLIAWVDGELDEVTRQRVDSAIADDSALARRLDMHRRLRARLAAHYEPIAREPIPDVLRSMLGNEGRVVPLVRAVPRWRGWATGGAIAASLALGLGIGGMKDQGPITVRGGVPIAQGQLARALETQLASLPEAAPIHVGLTFRRRGGGWCRSFDSVAISGVACRSGSGWQVVQLLPGSAESMNYRQASSGDARLISTIDALRDGEPVDATQEERAQAGGWR
ncbi:anti-sigma factor [Sphingobium sp. AN558]|uniref:anti-sigma factor family protein n=1 Tax=Sphingobium sp. AN558 TaxID=3133442 RepID=UPI0030C3615D